MKSAVRFLGLPVLWGLSVWATFALLGRGLVPGLALTITMNALFAVLLGLERWVPFRPEWNASDGQRVNDLAHAVVGTWGGIAVGNLALQALVSALQLRGVGALWPQGWPFLAQLGLVAALAELGRYVQHRLLHQVPFLWRFHVLHHDAKVLNVFKTARSHGFERIAQQFFMVGPLLLLGAPSDVVLWYQVPNSLLGLFDHSNVDFRLGALELFLVGPAQHRLHHALDRAESDSNFSSSLPLWDWVFGTFRSPLRYPAPEKLGALDENLPGSFVKQLTYPLSR